MKRLLFYGICAWMGLVSFQSGYAAEATLVGTILPPETLESGHVTLFQVVGTEFHAETKTYLYKRGTSNGVTEGPFSQVEPVIFFPLSLLKEVQVIGVEEKPTHPLEQLVAPLLLENEAEGEDSLLLQTMDGVWSIFYFRGLKIDRTNGDVRFFFPQALSDHFIYVQKIGIAKVLYLHDTGHYAEFLRRQEIANGENSVPVDLFLAPLQVGTSISDVSQTSVVSPPAEFQ